MKNYNLEGPSRQGEEEALTSKLWVPWSVGDGEGNLEGCPELFAAQIPSRRPLPVQSPLTAPLFILLGPLCQALVNLDSTSSCMVLSHVLITSFPGPVPSPNICDDNRVTLWAWDLPGNSLILIHSFVHSCILSSCGG